MKYQDVLFEIGTEELPPRALQTVAQALLAGMSDGLAQQQITFADQKVFFAPRRIAVLLTAVAEQQPEQKIERRGPTVEVAYDAHGQPTKALQGFLKSCSAELTQLETIETDKGSWLWFRSGQPGKTIFELLPNIITTTLKDLPVPKMMRWGNADEPFIRPVHWLVLLYGSQVVPFSAYGCQSSNKTYGHRYHYPDALTIGMPKDYLGLLANSGFVIADFEVRQRRIIEQVTQLALTVDGQAIIEPNLLAEVANIVEWPTALLCQFDVAFLAVPPEALIASMQQHQKCFAVTDSAGQLLPYFITVSNIASKQPGLVIKGNEKVMRARLSDAAFFYQADCKQRLEERLPALAKVTFQQKLGSLADKSERVAELAGYIAEQLQADLSVARHIAMLSKTDLMTEMVSEFPELQGIMGQYYAQHDGEPESVYVAIREHYMPRFAADDIPASINGQIVALADKIDTLVGIFGIGQLPTGSKDPFALRRAGIGALRIMIEGQLDLDMRMLVDQARILYGNLLSELDVVEQVWDFCSERLKGLAIDQGMSHDTFEALRALPIYCPMDLMNRMAAVEAFRLQDSAEHLVSANKRVAKLLQKQDAVSESISINPSLFEIAAEKALYTLANQLADQVGIAAKQGQYEQALSALSTLHMPIDDFFEQVMVMVEDIAIRQNRLALLQFIRQLFIQIADISKLQIG